MTSGGLSIAFHCNFVLERRVLGRDDAGIIFRSVTVFTQSVCGTVSVISYLSSHFYNSFIDAAPEFREDRDRDA